uniref:CSON008027 protein n=2 Tax=Culicoides sonorensis TaxID=179676 RepID=A0A336MZ59_CULSO
MHIGQSRDCPELREKIRKLRRSCVEACKHTTQLIVPQVRTAVAEGILTDNPHLVLLFYLSQLFLRELIKSHRLIQVIPMDMSGYYENRAGPSNLGNVISQILLCKTITPDFNEEELCSITKDSQEIARLLQDMQEFMPQQETYLERSVALTTEVNGPWPAKRRRGSLYKNMGFLCCVSRPNYL